MSRDEVISLSVKIDLLRKELARLAEVQRELRSAERKLDTLLGITELSSGETDESLMGRVIGLLDANPSKEFEAEDIFAEMPQENIASIRSVLSRASSQAVGRIARTGRGRYRSIKTAGNVSSDVGGDGLELVA